MIERVVENWLTSANERQYQIPFCQLLAAEGERILYISPHGQREQGKDVITLGPRRTVCAYQLKGGRLKLNDWRRYHGEIHELVTYPVDHPSVTTSKHHESILVTNGTVADTVLSAINSANRAWARVNAGPLRLVAGSELLDRFVKVHGRFLPRDPKDFRQFLELVVDSGASQFDKQKFASFLESILPMEVSRNVAPREAQRAIASAVLLTTYIIQGCERVENHWAIFEAWTMIAAYIGAVATKYKAPEKWWSTSLDLCVMAATRALDDLARECARNQVKFTQGNPFTDGHFYGSRITILAGLLGAASLSHHLRGEEWLSEDFVRQFLLEYLPRIRLWGESAVPYLILGALAIERRGHHAVAEGLVLQVLRTIAEVNGTKGRGIPNPYYEPEAALRITYGLDELNSEIFAGHSYTLEPLIHYLARRWIRRHLAVLWEKVTHVHFASFAVKRRWEYFRWRSDKGSLVTSTPKAPQSWKELLEEAEAPPKDIPRMFKRNPELALYFSLVYPHRLTPHLLKIIETVLQRGRT